MHEIALNELFYEALSMHFSFIEKAIFKSNLKIAISDPSVEHEPGRE